MTMMPTPTRVTATELARNLSDILNRIDHNGEQFVIEQDGQVIAILGPPDHVGKPTVQDLVDTLNQLPRLGPEFADDVEDIIARQSMTDNPVWE